MRKRAYIIIAVIAILSLSITAGELFFSGTPTAKKYTSEDSKAYIALNAIVQCAVIIKITRFFRRQKWLTL